MSQRLKLEAINAQLKQSFENLGGDSAQLNPWQIAGGLQACGVALEKYIEHVNSQLDPQSDAYVESELLDAVRALFKELSENFFPMAHTDVALENLQIVDKHKLNEFINMTCATVEDRMIGTLSALKKEFEMLIHP